MIVIALLLSLAACGTSSNNKDKESTQTNSEEMFAKETETTTELVEKSELDAANRRIAELEEEIAKLKEEFEAAELEIMAYEEALAAKENSTDSQIIKDGKFNFTPESFYDCCKDTIPDQYILYNELVSNPFLNGYLQYKIIYADEEKTDLDKNTGMTILFTETNPNSEVGNLSLAVSTYAEVSDFEKMLEWFISTFLPELDERDKNDTVDKYVEYFSNGESMTGGIMGKEYSLILERKDNGILSESYYITISR